MERGSWVGVVGVLASALVIGWTAAANWHDARDVLDAGVSYGLLLVLVASAVLVAAAAVGAVSLLRDPARTARPDSARGSVRAAAGRHPPSAGAALRPRLPAGARDHAASELAAAAGRGDRRGRRSRHGGVRGARRTRPHDAALDFAWSTAATIEPWVEGKNFFPRIFADVEAARSSVHILMFGWREGEVGTEMAELLERKLARRRRGARARRRLRLEAVRRGRGDVQRARGRRGADRRQRRPPGRPRRAVSRTTGGWTGVRTRWAAPTTASSTSSTAPSPGPAARGSRTTSRTAASTT